MGDTGRKKRKGSGEHKATPGQKKSGERKLGSSAERRALAAPPRKASNPLPLVLGGLVVVVGIVAAILAGGGGDKPAEPKGDAPVAKAPATPPVAVPKTPVPAEKKPDPPKEPEPVEVVPGPAPQTPPPVETAPAEKQSDVPKGVPATARKAKVVRCVDGDTILVSLDGKEEKIRMKGVDTPETKHPTKPVERFGKEASDFTKARLDKKTVWIEPDGPGGGRDTYGRMLAYIWLEDGSCHNATLIREGYAHAYTRYPFDRMEDYRRLEREAREAKRGLWGPDKK